MKLLLLSAASVPLLAGMALAQSGDEPRREETIIVSIPGPDRAADELVGNATQINREELVETLSGSLGDTLAGQPGVSTTFFGQGASRPVLRGLGAERVQVLTNGIGVIDASAASPDHQVAADGIDAEAIEILRGPAALAYGGQAIGGVVNVIDGLIAEELPEEAFSGEGFGAYNSVNEGTELGGRFQAVSGPFVFTLSASARDFGDYDIPGFAESAGLMALEEAEEEEHDEEEGEEHDHDEEEEVYGTAENSFLETQTLAAGLSWVGDNAFLGVAVRQQTAEYGLPGHGHEHEEEEGEEHDEAEHEEEEEESPFIDLEQTRIDLRSGIEFGETGFTDLTATLAIVDYEHIEFEAPGEAGTIYETEGVEGRVELGTAFGGLLGAAGIQFIDKTLDADGEEAFISETDTQSFGAFVYQTREWDSGFGVEGGLRLESVELSNVDQGSMDYDLFGGAFGLHQHLADGWFFGAQVAHTERAPNESELFAFGPHLATEQFEVGDATLDKESATNFEATARWNNDIVSFGGNFYVTDFSDFIYLTPGEAVIDGVLTDEGDELPVFAFQQEDADFYGGEIYGEAIWDEGFLGANWEATASIDFVQAELASGANVPFLPPVTLKAGTSAAWGPWEFGVSATHASDQDDPGVGQLRTDGYTVVDLRAEVDLADFGIGQDGTAAFIEMRNAGDEEVRYATSVLKDVISAPGQNIRIGLRATF